MMLTFIQKTILGPQLNWGTKTICPRVFFASANRMASSRIDKYL